MEIDRAQELGLCFGVRRALNMLRDAALSHGHLETLGPIAHNRVLLKELEALGVTTVSTPASLSGPTVVISAHGVGPDVMASLLDRGFTVIDTTCPNVARAQHIAEGMAHDGLTIVIFGDAHHSEVRGLLGWTDGKGVATLDADALSVPGASPCPAGIGVISQTTQREDDFSSFVQRICATSLSQCHEIRIVNTLCDATRRRQAAAATLARSVDAMVVIGGRASANTLRLTETCAAIVETYLVETADELPVEALRGKARIGLTAGASTPDSSIAEVEARLRRL